MNERTRIAGRLLGLVLLAAGIAGVVLLFDPQRVSDWLGESCRQSKTGPSETCTVVDALEILVVSPLMILIGFVLVISLRPEHKGPFTLDFSRGRR